MKFIFYFIILILASSLAVAYIDLDVNSVCGGLPPETIEECKADFNSQINRNAAVPDAEPQSQLETDQTGLPSEQDTPSALLPSDSSTTTDNPKTTIELKTIGIYAAIGIGIIVLIFIIFFIIRKIRQHPNIQHEAPLIFQKAQAIESQKQSTQTQGNGGNKK